MGALFISSRRSACRFSQSTGLSRARCGVEADATMPTSATTAGLLCCSQHCCWPASLQARQHPWLSHDYDEAPVAPAPGAPASDGAAAPVDVPSSQPDAQLEQAEPAPPAEPLPTPAVAVAADSSQAATTTEAPPAPDPVDKPTDELATKAEAVPDAAVEAEVAVASEGGDDVAKTS